MWGPSWSAGSTCSVLWRLVKVRNVVILESIHHILDPCVDATSVCIEVLLVQGYGLLHARIYPGIQECGARRDERGREGRSQKDGKCESLRDRGVNGRTNT